jgi:hypothetical protein
MFDAAPSIGISGGSWLRTFRARTKTRVAPMNLISLRFARSGPRSVIK